MRQLFILLCLIIAAGVYSQDNFVKGYVITNDNDTLNGYIDFRTNSYNSTLCRYKEFLNSNITEMKPGDIKAYRFLDIGKYYVSKNVEINGIAENYFLEYLVQGMLNLYYLPIENEEYYFFEDTSGKLIPVSKKPDKVLENRKLAVDNRYKGVLSYIFKDYPLLSEKTKDANFSRSSMIEFTTEYHNMTCTTGEECIIFTNDYKNKFLNFDFEVYSGFEYNIYRTKAINNLLDDMHSGSPVLGVELGLNSPRILKLVTVIAGANISKVLGRGEYSINGNNTYYRYDYNTMKLDLYGGLKLELYKMKVRPNLSLAFSNLYFINQKATLTQEFINYHSEIETKVDESFVPASSMGGFRVSAGVAIPVAKNHLTLNLAYSPHYSYYEKTNFYAYSLIVGYRF